VINYRLGVVPGVLAFFEAELDHLDGVVDVAAEDSVTRGMVRIGGEAGDMRLGLVDGEEGRLGQVLALGVLIGSQLDILSWWNGKSSPVPSLMVNGSSLAGQCIIPSTLTT
jgi:hypothetical protein